MVYVSVEMFHTRWFGGRRVLASNWNGKDRFEIKETAEQEAERLRKWDEFLESGDNKKESSDAADPDLTV